MQSASELFKKQCLERGMKKPSSATKKLFEEEDNMEDLEEVDLGDVYIGNRGIMALLDVVERAPSFRKITLASQKIYNTDLSPDSIKGNEVVDRVVEVCQAHPTVTSLDLSGNPLSNFAGRKLLHLANSNEKIVGINLEDTRIDVDLLGHIGSKCDKNLKAFWEKQNAEEEDDEKDCDEAFGHTTYAPPKERAPDLGGIGGGKRKMTVMGSRNDPDQAEKFKPPVYPKEPEDEAKLMELLRRIVLFNHLDRDSLKICVGAMIQRKLRKGETPLKQGEKGQTLFIILKGTCGIFKKGTRVAAKEEGSVFGELELMYDTPCVATVEVESEECVTWVLDRATYSNIVIASQVKKRKEYEEYLSRVQFLSTLSPAEKLQLSDALVSDEWEAGDLIIRHGDEGEWMFLVVVGTVEVIGRTEKGEETVVCDFSEGDHFGELEFLNNHTCVADVRAKTFVRTAKINRRHFELCLGPVLHVLKRNASDPKYEYYKKQLELAES